MTEEIAEYGDYKGAAAGEGVKRGGALSSLFDKEPPPKQSTALQTEIKKINALDRMKDLQEKKLAKHNRQVKAFEEMAIDFMVKHDVLSNPRHLVLKNREEYAGFYILATLEMLKFAVKEDYENAKTEI